MGVFLGQLPPAELARLKAELAETLIAYFCYPRFFDYRTGSLRTRPVDRAKRQEVWLYLSSVDFTAWNRVDLMSPDFQHYVERLFIHFVQRNRSFFGEQGRKRMADIRMLIGTTAVSVVQGLRGHLSGNPQKKLPFGSPRPVSSWSTTNITGRPEPTWEQIASPTLLLQQQVQEARGEIKLDARPTASTARRSNHVPAGNITNGVEHAAHVASPAPIPSTPSLPAAKSTSQVHVRDTPPLTGAKTTTHVNPAWNMSTAPSVSVANVDSAITPVETPAVPVAFKAVPVKSPGVNSAPLSSPEIVLPPVPAAAVQPSTTPSAAPSAAPSATLSAAPPAAPAVVANSHDLPTVVVADGDIAIFEQLRYQLVLWLRIEVVRSGMDISNQGPSQLLELLRQQNLYDESRLQIVSTLLNLANQVIKNGQATLFDYRQALMFHLMHTKR